MNREPLSAGRTALERILDGPERALLRLPWPSTPRIILEGSFGFLRQIARSRVLTRDCRSTSRVGRELPDLESRRT